jgi:hypothetical protein
MGSIKIVVLNNFGDGMVMQWQRLFFKGRLSASDKSLRKKDFVKTAQADGFGYAKRLDKKVDVPRVLEEFLSFKGAAFLEVVIDPEAGVYPMVGPGLSYLEMITGDFIPNRYSTRTTPEPAPPNRSSRSDTPRQRATVSAARSRSRISPALDSRAVDRLAHLRQLAVATGAALRSNSDMPGPSRDRRTRRAGASRSVCSTTSS